MNKLLQAKFLPINSKKDAFLDYHNLIQQNYFISECVVEFDRSYMHSTTKEEDEYVIESPQSWGGWCR